MAQLINATKKHPNLHPYKKSELDKIAIKCGTDKSSKFNGYVYHYERHFEHLRKQPINLLEMGVHQGYSHKMWAEYFTQANIYGIDIDKESQNSINKRIDISILDLDNPVSVQQYIYRAPEFDIIIDDASHTMSQQQSNFDNFFKVLKPGGIYVIEDLGTSYWWKWGGDYGKHGTTIDFLKSLVDHVNHEAYTDCTDAQDFDANILHRPHHLYDEIASVYFHKYICFIYKNA